MTLPPKWKLRSLGEFIAELEAGVSVNSDDVPADSGEPGVLKVSAVYGGRFLPMENKRVLPSEHGRLAVSPRPGSIIISRSNTALLVAENAFIEQSYPTLFLSDKLWQTIYHPDVEFEPLWLSQVLQSPRVRQQLVRLATGTSLSMKNISKSVFLDLEVPSPPVTEQRKIAAILGAWDRGIEKLQALVTAKVERLRALGHQLLTGTRRFPEFKRQTWVSKRIGDILVPVNRYEKWDDKRVFKLAGVRRNSGGLFFRDELLGSEIKVKTCKKIHSGDFLISRRQITWGGMSIVPPEFHGFDVNDEYEVLQVKDAAQFDMRFFHYLSQTAWLKNLAYLASNGVFAERLRLNFDLDAFLNHSIQIPSAKQEQLKVITLLDTCANEIRLLETELAALKLQKRGLMQKLLTGEVRVKL